MLMTMSSVSIGDDELTVERTWRVCLKLKNNKQYSLKD